MSSYRDKQKSLKAPDRLQILFAQALDWGQKNARQLAMVALPLVLLGVAIFAYMKYRAYLAEDRADELAHVDRIFEQEAEAADEKRREIWQEIMDISAKQIDGNRTGDKKDAQAEATKKANDEKVKELNAKLGQVVPDRQKSVKAYEEFIASYPGTREAANAQVSLASIYIEQKNFPKAKETLAAVLAVPTKERFYLVNVAFLMAAVHEELQEYDAALGRLDSIHALGEADLQPRVLIQRARIKKLAGNAANATADLEEVLAKHEASTEAASARALLALWRIQG